MTELSHGCHSHFTATATLLLNNYDCFTTTTAAVTITKLVTITTITA